MKIIMLYYILRLEEVLFSGETRNKNFYSDWHIRRSVSVIHSLFSKNYFASAVPSLV